MLGFNPLQISREHGEALKRFFAVARLAGPTGVSGNCYGASVIMCVACIHGYTLRDWRDRPLYHRAVGFRLISWVFLSLLFDNATDDLMTIINGVSYFNQARSVRSELFVHSLLKPA